INRAHLGYKYTPEGNFSSEIMINIGTPEDLLPGAVPKRYSYFREAAIIYTKDRLTVNFGIVGTRTFDLQQGFWGKRYLGPEFQAKYGYGSVADLGVVVDYRFNDLLKIDLSLLNGKGYTNIQYDNSLKTAAGITITTPWKLTARLYGDIMKPLGVWQSTMIAFSGFRNDHFSFGAEASYKTNLDLVNGHDVWGASATGSFFLGEKSEIFMRYDYAASLLLEPAVLQWDYATDGTYIIAGFQHIFSDNLKAALNYRRANPYEPGGKILNSVYLNAMFKF
ncbi:MAG TPA: hypothetical protein VLR52_02265, partial [Bacteroidales bacterium]|nr:hypothetical protein [Bacteroidales bacterium]